jgi:NADH-quinone oxidoreductase subunit C
VTQEELLERLAAGLATDVAGSPAYGVPCVDVPLGSWVAALTFARDDLGFSFFDWLTAVDELDEGFTLAAHLFDTRTGAGMLLRTRIPPDVPGAPTATGVFAGASWHERETYEMFGIDFEGHPNLVPLLLPDGFEGNPLRKSFVLASRAAKAWPGAKEPGESDAEGGSPSRRKTLPPGVPPLTWGPRTTATVTAAITGTSRGSTAVEETP